MEQETTPRKTSLMRAIERNHRTEGSAPTIREILVATYNRERSLDRAAAELGVSEWTLRKWFEDFEIEVRPIAV